MRVQPSGLETLDHKPGGLPLLTTQLRVLVQHPAKLDELGL